MTLITDSLDLLLYYIPLCDVISARPLIIRNTLRPQGCRNYDVTTYIYGDVQVVILCRLDWLHSP